MKKPFKIEEGTCVVIHLHSPREKLWGLITDISMAGIQIRGIDLHTFDDWLRMITRNEHNIALTHVFFPMWRVERITFDETVGEIPSLQEVFQLRVGISLKEYLGEDELIS
ncbi:MAG: hypothetical protein FD167_3625 [bacterium]|nr:MAG: hypothetical protein FD167_3625 [bacterium]